MFKRAFIALAAVAAFGAQAAGGLGVSIGTQGAGSSVTVVQGGSTNTVMLGNSSTPAISSSFTSMSFDASTWTVTGGTFTAYAAPQYYVSATNINTYVTDVKSALNTAVQNEVTYIGSLVTDVSVKVGTYNSEFRTDTDDGSAVGSTASQAAKDVSSAMKTLTTEVSTTKSAVDFIKTMKFTNSWDLTATTKTLNGVTVDDYTAQVSNIVKATGGSNTLNSATGAITFGP